MASATTALLPPPIKVILRTNILDPSEFQAVEVFDAEACLAELVRQNAEVIPAHLAEIKVNGLDVWRPDWPRTVAEAGDEVEIFLIPEGGDGQGAKIAQVLVTLVALVLIASGVGALHGAWLMAGAAAINVGISLIFPPPIFDFKDGGTDNAPQLTSVRNELRLWSPVPWVLGKDVRTFPPFAAKPFTEVIGGEQFLRIIFAIHGGEVTLPVVADCRLGDEELASFSDVEFQAHPGDGTTAALTLFTQDVSSTGHSRILPDAGSEIYTTEDAAAESTLDIAFPVGLYSIKSNGKQRRADYFVRWEFRLESTAPGGGWTDVVLAEPLGLGVTAEAGGGEYRVRNSQRGSTIRGFRIIFPTEDKYQVRVTKYQATQASGGNTIYDDGAYVNIIRSIHTPPTPIVPLDVAHIALRIRSTDQLQGQLDSFNLVTTPLVHSYIDGPGFTQTESDNPSWNLLGALRLAMSQYAIPDAQIDLFTFIRFAQYCLDNDYTIHGSIIDESRFGTWAQQIASTARARLTLTNGKYGVSFDGEHDTVTQVITDRNSKAAGSRYILPEQVHALRVRFEEKATPGEVSERLVYADGYNLDGSGADTQATIFREIDFWGVGDSDLIWRHGRYHLAAARLRRRMITREMDWENLALNVGDRIDLQHSTGLMGGQPSRLISLTGLTKQTITIVLDAPVTLEAGMNYEVQFRKANMKSETVPLDQVGLTADYLTLTGGTGSADAWDDTFPPDAGDLVVIGEPNITTLPMIVISVSHLSDLRASVALADLAPGIALADTGTIPTWNPTLSRIIPGVHIAPPSPVITNIESGVEVLRHLAGGRVLPRIVVAFFVPEDADAGAFQIQSQYRVTEGPGVWQQVPVVDPGALQLSVEPIEDGETYDIRLRSIRSTGVASVWSYVNMHTAVGRSEPPPDATDFRRETNRLIWEVKDAAGADLLVPDLDGFLIRYNFGTSTTWSTSLPAHTGVLRDLLAVPLAELPMIVRGQVVTILIKLVDIIGLESTAPLFIVTTLNDLAPINLAQVYDPQTESPAWPGVKVNCTVNGSGLLVATSDTGGFWSGNDGTAFWMSDASLFWVQSFLEAVYYDETPDAILAGVWKLTAADIDGQWSLDYKIPSISPTASSEFFPILLTPAISTGTIRNNGVSDYAGMVGYVFESATDQVINVLGVWDGPTETEAEGLGLEDSSEVGIWLESSGALLGSVVVPSGTGGRLIDGFRYGDIAPIELQAGVEYIVGAMYTTAGNAFIQWPSGFTPNTGITPGADQSLYASGGVFRVPDTPAAQDFAYIGPVAAFTGYVPWPSEVEVPTGAPGALGFRLVMPAGASQGIARELEFTLDPPDITEFLIGVVNTGSGTERASITETYNTIKEVFVTITGAMSASAAIGFRVVDKNAASGPHIQLINASGTVVAGVYDVEIIGY